MGKYLKEHTEILRGNQLKPKFFLPASLGGSVDNLWSRLLNRLIPYEKDVIDFYERHAPYNVSVDIGASLGYHTKRLAKISNKVIAIEPVSDLIGMPDNVEIHRVAAGRRHETKKMDIFGTGMKVHSGVISTLSGGQKRKGKKNWRGQKTVKVVPLDDIVTEADFLKVDVEGYELEVLEPSSILRSVDYAVIELHGANQGVRNLVDYQTRIFRLLEDFRVYASEIKSYVTINDVPLREMRVWCGLGKGFGYDNNHRLLCIRKKAS